MRWVSTALVLLAAAGGCAGGTDGPPVAPPTTPVSREPPPEPPGQPTGVRVAERGSDFLVWIWDPVEGATSYRVDVFPDRDPSELTWRGVTEQPTVRVDGLEPGVVMGIFVRAIRETAGGRAVGPWSVYARAQTGLPGSTLEGRVSDRETGRSLSGALVRILDGDHAGLEQRTGADGRYRFEEVAGDMTLSVTLAGYDGQRAAVNVDRYRTLDFQLERLSELLGQPTGVRVARRGPDFLVWIWDPVEGATSYQAQVFPDRDPASEPSWRGTTEQPTVRVDGLEPGVVMGIFVRAVRQTAGGRAVGPWSVYARAQAGLPGFTLEGRVSDRETGRSLSGALVRILDGDHAGLEQRTGADGRYRFEEVAGDMTLSVTLAGYDGQRAAVNVDQDRTLDFQLERPGLPGFVLEGRVSDQATDESLSGARVLILDDDNAGREQFTGADGRYRFEDVTGNVNVAATLDGYYERRVELDVNEDRTLDFQLERLLPGKPFGDGSWLVNDDIIPGRYFSNPVSGCFWERVGATGDIIASEFLGFDAGQEIVDISASDHAFNTDAECRTWRPSPSTSVTAGVVLAGRWLVGQQVRPGEYVTEARPGCYWARLRSFSGETRRDVIDNEFVSDRGRQRVEIGPTDVGFYSDADCGTWTRVGNVSASWNDEPGKSQREIDRNEQLYRSHEGIR